MTKLIEAEIELGSWSSGDESESGSIALFCIIFYNNMLDHVI